MLVAKVVHPTGSGTDYKSNKPRMHAAANALCKIFPRREKNGKTLSHWSDVETYLDNGTESMPDIWHNFLTPREYAILRCRGTERPRSSVYDKFFPNKGHFCCRACGQALYSARTKSNAGTGYPAFGRALTPYSVVASKKNCTIGESDNRDCAQDSSRSDHSIRHISCGRCSSNLGYLIKEKNTTMDENSGSPSIKHYTDRHSVNGTSLMYVSDKHQRGLGSSRDSWASTSQSHSSN